MEVKTSPSHSSPITRLSPSPVSFTLKFTQPLVVFIMSHHLTHLSASRFALLQTISIGDVPVLLQPHQWAACPAGHCSHAQAIQEAFSSLRPDFPLSTPSPAFALQSSGNVRLTVTSLHLSFCIPTRQFFFFLLYKIHTVVVKIMISAVYSLFSMTLYLSPFQSLSPVINFLNVIIPLKHSLISPPTLPFWHRH